MGRTGLFTAMLASALLAVPAPVSAQAQDTVTEAEQLRRLDIMLMVTALRCRFGVDDFQADYERFTARHLAVLNEAGRQLQHGHGHRHLDRISTTMANRYGQGHPWLGCAELHGVAQQLSAAPDRHELLAAADELLGDSPRRASLVASYTP